jgi:NADPH-dependent 2,4-dienoyl-CoA reductase/sulfur reductase-like enzyme
VTSDDRLAKARATLRIRESGIRPVVPLVSFNFDGQEIAGYEGETIAAALAAAGRAQLGRRRNGSARGLFCGMGVCQECIVTVDGEPGRRACMTSIVHGMNVISCGYAVAPPPSAVAAGPSPTIFEEPEILVVGGGPAGLSAARGAALCGTAVALIDERAMPGGQFFKQVAKTHATASAALDRQFREGGALIAEVERLGVRVWRDSAVWGAFGAAEIAVIAEGRQRLFKPKRLILATGAYERGVPMPGWTLPGFMTTGAAQTLMRAYRVLPGRRVLVAGNGPLNLQVAADLVSAGVEVVAVAEAAAMHVRHSVELLRAGWHAPGLIRDGLSYLHRLRRAGVPIYYRSAVIAAYGEDRVGAARLARLDDKGRAIPGSEFDVRVDAICAGYGFLPSNEIARSLGCRHDYQAEKGLLVPVTDENGRTTVPDVYVVGDAAGLGGAYAARERGFLAACAAAQSLGHHAPADVERERTTKRRELSHHRAFQRALWRLFDAPVLTTQHATGDTVICRCEDVRLDEISRAAQQDDASLAAIKRQTRAGMGRCQGRYCTPILAALLAKQDTPRDETALLAPRPPLKPVRLRDLAQEPDA